MLEQILSKVLTERQRKAGLSLTMETDHTLALIRAGKPLAHFNNRLDLAQVLAIQETAEMYLEDSPISIA